MKPRFVMSDEAKANANRIFDWLYQKSPSGAEKWLKALHEGVNEIVASPEVFALASEPMLASEMIREHFFKTKYGRLYRLLYKVVGSEIHIVYVRGPGQSPIT